MAKNRTDAPETGTATMPPPQAEPPRPRVPQVGDVVHLLASVGIRSNGVVDFSSPAKITHVHPGPELRVDLSIDHEIPHYDCRQAPRGSRDFRRMENMWTWLDEDGEHSDLSPLMVREQATGLPRDHNGRPQELPEELPEPGDKVGVYCRNRGGYLVLMPARVTGFSDDTTRRLDVATVEPEITTRVAPGRGGPVQLLPFHPAGVSEPNRTEPTTATPWEQGTPSMNGQQIDQLVSERVAEALEVRDVFAARTAELKGLCRHYAKHLDENEIAEIIVLDDDGYEAAKARIVKSYAKGGSLKPPGSGAPSPREAAACVEYCTQRGIPYSREALEEWRAHAG